MLSSQATKATSWRFFVGWLHINEMKGVFGECIELNVSIVVATLIVHIKLSLRVCFDTVNNGSSYKITSE